MGVLVRCDAPDNDEEPMNQGESVQVIVQISDPETGLSQTRAFFCTKHADEFATNLQSQGFPGFEV